MEIGLEFKGLEELIKAFQKAASDSDIKETNKRIVERSQQVVKDIMKPKIPKSKDMSKSGCGFGSKSHVTAHAADNIPLEKVKFKDTSASGETGWNKGDNSEHFYMKFVNWGTIYQPPKNFIKTSGKEAEREIQKIAEQEYQAYLDRTMK